VHYWADLESVHGFRCYDNKSPNVKCQRVLVLALCLVLSLSQLHDLMAVRCAVTSQVRSAEETAQRRQEEIGRQAKASGRANVELRAAQDTYTDQLTTGSRWRRQKEEIGRYYCSISGFVMACH